ncbi:MAG: hypothetical protein ABI904_03405 [Chloroflexota bacterium]
MNIKKNDLLWIVPLALVLGAGLASLQPGNWLIGFASFSFLFLLSFSLFAIALRWVDAAKTLTYILALTFALRFLVGVSLYVFLPIYGHTDADDRAGFVFTDAHRRDDEAWGLASSERPIYEAFSQKFAYDQYGGLLAFSALVYRYLSPDAHRPLMLILISAIVAAVGIPFLWRAVNQVFGEKVAWAAAWIFALYPESILLGASIMREPYLLTFSALALYGFVNSGVQELAPAPDSKLSDSRVAPRVWLALGLLGMLLVSPAIAIAHLIIFAGWVFFANEQRTISWKAVLVFAVIFFVGLFFLSASLNRSGEFNASSPLSVVNDWLKLAVKWNAYGIERDSGWVQKLFDEMPQWMRLPFVAVYGVLQPVLPAALTHPTEPIWQAIYILRALGWYALLPALILSFGTGAGQGSARNRNLILWLALLSWTWVLLAALRAGGDQWDNPRYRTILFLWQAILAGVVWVWWREGRSAWFVRVIACEVVFLLVFTQWYVSRYYHWGGQLSFPVMMALIFGLWVAIVGLGVWRDRKPVR